MDALVRLHETHTGGSTKTTQLMYPVNTTTLATAKLPLLNGTNTGSIEKWISTRPTQLPMISNKITKQAQVVVNCCANNPSRKGKSGDRTVE